MNKKIAAVWLSWAMMLSFIVIIEIAQVVEAPTTWYVDDVPGSGSGNPPEDFTSIQDAINASGDGDTIYVYNGTYIENVIVNKTLNLTGENKNTTIVDGGWVDDPILVSSDWVNISGFTVTHSGIYWYDAGIDLSSVENCKITDNIATVNSRGFLLYYSNRSILSSNLAIDNWDYGFSIRYSNNNTITDNNASYSDRGFFMMYSNDNMISRNIGWNNGYGIDITNSRNNTIELNNFYLCWDRGIYIDYSNENQITGNGVISGSEGICFYNSNNNNVTYNNASLNYYDGFDFSYSSDNYIHGNKAFFNGMYGMAIFSSQRNDIKNNILVRDGFIVSGDLLEHWNSHNLDTSNTVNGKPVYYWKNQTVGTVPIGAGQVILANCTKINVKYQDLTFGSLGIELGFSSNNNITGNNASLNNYGSIYLYNSNGNNITNNNASSSYSYGIRVFRSSYNKITNNNASNNWAGIYLSSSSNENIIIGNNISSNTGVGIRLVIPTSNNVIYHNHILNNSNQAFDYSDNGNQWDNGYPIGGNYWSDYIGDDIFKGPKQNIQGSDGIGDTPYVIDADSQDNYPLVQPYKAPENYTVLKQGWNLISIPLIQTNHNLTKVLEMIDGYYDAVQWYDITDKNDPWEHHKVNKPFGNDLTKINETMGFWIHITQPGDTIFLYNGTQPTQNQTITLQPGWNLVGYPSLTSYNRTDGLNNLTFDTHVNTIWTYDAATQKWKELGPSDYFEIGKGYWIHANTKCEWEVPL